MDTEGNQLPYIDKIQMTLAENLEVLNLRAIAGEYDWQERHIDLGKLPVFLGEPAEGQLQGPPRPPTYGADATFQINQSFEADPEVGKWLRNGDFRRALSLGIDRDQLNETFWLGIGTPGSVGAGRAQPVQPRPGVAHQWATSSRSRRMSCWTRSG